MCGECSGQPGSHLPDWAGTPHHLCLGDVCFLSWAGPLLWLCWEMFCRPGHRHRSLCPQLNGPCALGLLVDTGLLSLHLWQAQRALPQGPAGPLGHFKNYFSRDGNSFSRNGWSLGILWWKLECNHGARLPHRAHCTGADCRDNLDMGTLTMGTLWSRVTLAVGTLLFHSVTFCCV